MGLEIPEKYGGAGANFFSSIIAIEELAKVDSCIGGLGIYIYKLRLKMKNQKTSETKRLEIREKKFQNNLQ
jgi:alkylation response protein AidB-like acyl-CoA dehydrogenase